MKIKKYQMPDGRIVFEYPGHTYGCCAPNEIATTDVPGNLPFLGVDKDLLKEIGEVEAEVEH